MTDGTVGRMSAMKHDSSHSSIFIQPVNLKGCYFLLHLSMAAIFIERMLISSPNLRFWQFSLAHITWKQGRASVKSAMNDVIMTGTTFSTVLCNTGIWETFLKPKRKKFHVGILCILCTSSTSPIIRLAYMDASRMSSAIQLPPGFSKFTDLLKRLNKIRFKTRYVKITLDV